MQRSYTQTQLTRWWSSTGELQPLLHGAFIAGEIRQQVCWANLMFSHWGAGFFWGGEGRDTPLDLLEDETQKTGRLSNMHRF